MAHHPSMGQMTIHREPSGAMLSDRRLRGTRGRSLATFFGVFLLLIIALFPVLWTFLSSFKTEKDIAVRIPKLLFEPTLSNYLTVLQSPDVQTGLINSVTVVGVALLIGVLFGIPAAHALARYGRRIREDVQFFVLSIRFTPPVAIALPAITVFQWAGLTDTLLSVILVYSLTTISTIIWLGVPAFQDVPVELEEAARLDGLDSWGVFFRVALPLAIPSLVGALLFTFVITWNELLMALILTSKDTTLPVVAAGFTTLGMEVPRGLINASAILLALPPLLLIGLILRFIDGFLEKKSS
jgi:multiple sugar transport system permease protein